MTIYLVTILFVFAIFAGGVLVDRVYRSFADRNPALGPFRPSGKQSCCSCTAGSGCGDAVACATSQPADTITIHRH